MQRDRVGPWILRELIGSGSSARVYRAVRTAAPPGTPDVALKVFEGDHSDLVVDEILNARRLRHVNLVRVIDAGTADGAAFIAMELVEGITLETLLTKHGPVPPERAVPIAIRLSEVLGYLHEHGVIHRDLKPSNIMFRNDDVELDPLLTDLGLAGYLELDTGKTAGGQIFGSPAYMAPEQLRGMPQTPAADVWGLAACTYEMLSGKMLFRATTLSGAWRATQEERPQYPPELPQGLRGILDKALTKEPEQRPTMDWVRRALTSWLQATQGVEWDDDETRVKRGSYSELAGPEGRAFRSSQHAIWKGAVESPLSRRPESNPAADLPTAELASTSMSRLPAKRRHAAPAMSTVRVPIVTMLAAGMSAGGLALIAHLALHPALFTGLFVIVVLCGARLMPTRTTGHRSTRWLWPAWASIVGVLAYYGAQALITDATGDWLIVAGCGAAVVSGAWWMRRDTGANIARIERIASGVQTRRARSQNQETVSRSLAVDLRQLVAEIQADPHLNIMRKSLALAVSNLSMDPSAPGSAAQVERLLRMIDQQIERARRPWYVRYAWLGAMLTAGLTVGAVALGVGGTLFSGSELTVRDCPKEPISRGQALVVAPAWKPSREDAMNLRYTWFLDGVRVSTGSEFRFNAPRGVGGDRPTVALIELYAESPDGDKYGPSRCEITLAAPQ